MARKKKRDFWDDVEEEEVTVTGSAVAADIPYDGEDSDDGHFHPTRSLPVKIILRALLLVMAAVTALSGYILYRYFEDRYDAGFTTSYFGSRGFSEKYNEEVLHVLKIVDAAEKDPTLVDTQEKVSALAESTLGGSGNFSFLVQNDQKQTLYASSEDAKDRIESSNHFMRLSNDDGEFMVDVGGVPIRGLNRESWKAAMESLQNRYIIYTSVDNNLDQSGLFYDSYLAYQQLNKYFSIARFTAIGGLILFIVLLVFCAIGTGMHNGSSEVSLSWFDYIYTELAAFMSLIVLGALIFGMWFVNDRQLIGKNTGYLLLAGAVLFYVILIRSYFSLVRRIKTGRFVADSLIYRVGHKFNQALNHLPRVLKGIIVFLLLVLLNGGLIFALLYLREFTIKDVPVVFIVVPLIFVIELIAFISCLFGGVPVAEEEEDDDIYDGEGHMLTQERDNGAQRPAEQEIDPEDWQNIDFSRPVSGIGQSVLPEAEDFNGATVENVMSPSSDKTVRLSEEEMRILRNRYENSADNSARAQRTASSDSTAKGRRTASSDSTAKGQRAASSDSAAKGRRAVSLDSTARTQRTAPADSAARAQRAVSSGPSGDVSQSSEDENLVNFIQLNKDVRKMFSVKLKNQSIGVTLRAPERPIMLDIDKSNAIRVLSILFDNVVKYAQAGSRVYIEMYVQKGKMIYMMKNTIREDLVGQVSGEMGEDLKMAKNIIRSEGGKFITAVDGNTFKAGILLKAED